MIVLNFIIYDDIYEFWFPRAIVVSNDNAQNFIKYAYLNFGVARDEVRLDSIEPFIEDGQEIVDGDEDLPF